MSILVMVVQSWEDEARRLRGKDISPCRLLFLDEAARLDAAPLPRCLSFANVSICSSSLRHRRTSARKRDHLQTGA
jgi:hypothetical protein